MKNEILNKNNKFFLLITFIIIIDQVSKILSGIFLQTKFTLMPSLLWLTPVSNRGAAFGIFQGRSMLLGLLNIVVAIVIIYLYISKKQTKYSLSNTPFIPLAFIVGGAIGNAYDRIILGFVVDFIDLGWWPVFNVADSFIFIGVFWLIFLQFRPPKHL